MEKAINILAGPLEAMKRLHETLARIVVAGVADATTAGIAELTKKHAITSAETAQEPAPEAVEQPSDEPAPDATQAVEHKPESEVDALNRLIDGRI